MKTIDDLKHELTVILIFTLIGITVGPIVVIVSAHFFGLL